MQDHTPESAVPPGARLLSIFGSPGLLWFLARREVIVRYRSSALGLMWSLAQPLPLALVLLAVFSSSLGSRVEGYVTYVLTGVVFWSFVSHSVLATLNSLQRNRGALRNAPAPAAAFPVAAVLAGLFHLTLSSITLVVFLPALGGAASPALLALPVAMLLTATFALGLGMGLAPFALRYADVGEATQLTLGVIAYATPIFYHPSILPPRLATIVDLNPLTMLLSCFRQPVHAGALPSISQWGEAAGWSAAMLVVGFLLFRSQEPGIRSHV